jgi:nucleotide-binding universal stress UspA family protein
MKPSLILNPLVLSPNGKPAAARALAIARWYDADLHVLQLGGRRSRRSVVPAPMPLTDERLDPRVTAFLTALNPEEVPVSVVELPGDPVTAVSTYARLAGADLIVVGKYGRPNGLYRRPGIFARDVARHTSTPTLTVPETGEAPSGSTPPFAEILCPMDFSDAGMAALDRALVLAQESGGRLTLLHVLEAFPYETVYSGARAFQLVDDYRSRVAAISRDLRRLVPPDALNWSEVRTSVVSGVVHRAILETASEMRADVIVMGMPDRSTFGRFVMGSATGPVLREANCPVLLVPPVRAEQAAGDSESVTDVESGGFRLPLSRAALRRTTTAVAGSDGAGAGHE